jgi:hypothetical protein
MPAITKTIALFLFPALLCGCQTMSQDQSAELVPPGSFAKGTPEWRGQKFARNRCSDCHAVPPVQTSAVANAPSFDAIGKKPDLTRESLTQFLNSVNAHPREMYFEIPKEHVDDLVSYMLTLRPEGRDLGD